MVDRVCSLYASTSLGSRRMASLAYTRVASRLPLSSLAMARSRNAWAEAFFLLLFFYVTKLS